MTSELSAIIEYYEKEKGIEREVMLDALENALLTAAKKSIGPAREMRVKIEPNSGSIKVMANLIVVDKVKKPYDQVYINVARKINPEVEIDDEIEVDITPKNFGRIAAQNAKQVIMQRIKLAEREMMYEEYKDRAGEIISGIVRRFERSNVLIDLGKFEAIMPENERVPNEDYTIGERIRVYVVSVENQSRGPEIILSRSHPNFVKRLFEIEVTEVSDGTVEIRNVAREPGYRTKIAVYSSDPKVDPVGACVGLRGSRVKNIVRELNNEKIDIVRWSSDIREFVTDSMKPAQVNDIKIDEDEHCVFVTVSDVDLSKAIGRKGQNARLTSKLLGWDLKISKDETASEIFEQRMAYAAKSLAKKLGISEDLTKILVASGINSIEVIKETSADDISEILDIEPKEAGDIIAKAKSIPVEKNLLTAESTGAKSS